MNKEEPQVFTRWIDPTTEQLQQKIDKAIEYIKKNSYGWETKYFQDEALASELLEILGDKENE